MFCQHCGTDLKNDYKYCPHCGHAVAGNINEVLSHAKGPFWFKLFSSITLLICVVGLFVLLSPDDLTQIVEDQLKALRQDRLTQAYYDFTSQSFQEATSLETFGNFVKSYPFLTTYHSIRFIDRNVDNDQGRLEAIISPKEGKDLQVQYRLIKENGRWKILSIKLEDPTKK